MDLTNEERNLLQGLLTRDSSPEAVALAAKLEADRELGDLAARQLDAAIGVIADLRLLLQGLAAEFGGLVALVDRLWTYSLGEDLVVKQSVNEAQSWLVQLRALDARIASLIDELVA